MITRNTDRLSAVRILSHSPFTEPFPAISLPKLLMLVVALLSVLMFAGRAYCDLLSTFELDGNAVTQNSSSGLPDDWDRVNGYVSGNSGQSALATGVIPDPQGHTMFTSGSKDYKDISDLSWADQNVPDKDDISNAYAALYAPNTLFFGADRVATNGTSYIGFWLLQGSITRDPDGTFSGHHVVGDILVLSNFTGGGGKVSIHVYKWLGPGGSEASLQELSISSLIADAVVNSTDQPSPWPYTPKNATPGIFPTGAFFEGGADLAALGITGCFTDFLAETRSAAGLDAELKDFVLGKFPATPEVTVDSATVCQGNSAPLCATTEGGVGPFTYLWNTAATTSCINVSEAGTYTVLVTGANGCSAQGSGTLTVNPAPVCSITRTGAEGDTVCPCSLTQDPKPTVQFCGPVEMASYSWSIQGGGKIIGDTDGRCVEVQSDVSCDTSYTLTLSVTDGNSCSSTCNRYVHVADKTPPQVTYCPPDTVIDCQNLTEFWPSSMKPAPRLVGVLMPAGVDNCGGDVGVDYADGGGRPTNWMPRIEGGWGSCGQDTTILRTWYVRDFCGNVDSSCVQVIAIQDTIPPMLTCAPPDTVPCGSDVVFTDPGAEDNCDPQRLINLAVMSTDTIPGPGPGQFIHTRCWAATDSCQNLSPVCCQSVLVEACPDKFCTFTMGGWGSACPDSQRNEMGSTQPGCVRDHYFDQVFPNGVLIGDPTGIPGIPGFFAARWTSAAGVEGYLPADGTPRFLKRDLTDPATTSAGTLAGQILALRMNREYSCAGVFADVGLQESPTCYGAYVVPGFCGKFAGLTVDRFLAIADSAVGGKTQALAPYGATLSDVNFTATCLNKTFDNCDVTVRTTTPDRQISPSAEVTLSAEVQPSGEATNSALVPREFAVRQSYPNPFNPSVTIVYGLPEDGRVTIEVYDIVGRRITLLLDEQKQAGYHSIVWFGRDSQERPVASGVYFCKVQFGTLSAIKKLLLLK